MVKTERKFKKITIDPSLVIKRGEGGVIHIEAADERSLQKGLGFAHATDRPAQLLLGRLLASGKMTQYFKDTDEIFAVDLLIRKMGIAHDERAEIENLSDEAKEWCAAYCEGVNACFEKYGQPLLCRLLKIPLVPWTLQDMLSLMKMYMYLGLAQAQERTERFILQAIHDGVDVSRLKKIFEPYLDSLDDETVGLIQKLSLERPYLNAQMRFTPALSNNWAVSAAKSHSGKPLCAHDPHLQVNRLPAFWYEAVLQTPDRWQMGITIPGFPGIIMGRSQNLVASFTYGMMDTIDFFIEEIQGGRFRREKGWEQLSVREEVIERKKSGAVKIKFFETDAGVIEREAYTKDQIEDGLYLAVGWSGSKKGVSAMINAFAQLWRSNSVFEAGKAVRNLPLSSNWILADGEGNIAYQQAGKLPNRSQSGLFPVPAWKEQNLWQGFIEGDLLKSEYNPPRGFVASANDDKNQEGRPLSISVPYASYRYERICQVLSQDKTFNLDEMRALQCDLYSLQAERFLKQVEDLIPDTPQGVILRQWDYTYAKESKGATLFEAFYLALIQEVFGRFFGETAWKKITTTHSLLIFTHGHFDRILLSDDESWYGSEGKKGCAKRVLEQTLTRFTQEIPSWGTVNSFVMKNLYFGGRLPKFLGFDIGPVEMEGSRATVAASFIVKEGKRIIVGGATHRFLADLALSEADTILAGGPSENRFSSYYVHDVPKWLNLQYKKLKIDPSKK